MSRSPDALIVGAGIVGLSTAYWLTRAGLKVTVVEAGTVPNANAASADHHRLIRYFYGDRVGYTARMAEGYAAWRTMWADLPAADSHYLADTGILTICQEAGDGADLSRRTLEQLGLPFERIDGAELSRRFAFLEAANISYALIAEGGALMANRILVDLAFWLRANGCGIMELSPVGSVDLEGGTVRLADGRVLSAGQIVLAAGVGTAQLVPDLGLPLEANRTMIVYAEPPDDLKAAYAQAPCWSNLGGGSGLWGMPGIDGLPMKLGNSSMGRPEPTVSERTMSAAQADAVVAPYRGRFRGIERFSIRWYQANYWTAAPNEEFALWRDGRGLIVSADSGHGFKFGALSGRDVAGVVVGETSFEAARAALAAHI